MKADAALPMLRAAYIGGRLAPFIGSGMSSNLSGWATMVDMLATDANTPSLAAMGRRDTSDELVLLADRASIRLRAEGRLEVAVRKALGDSPGMPPAQTLALAKLPWPLVLTTNYDDIYVSEASQQLRSRRPMGDPENQERPVVLGRSAADCRRVLRSLQAPDHPIVWALQGFVGGQAKSTARLNYDMSRLLGNEIVVGHAEYRRTANAEPYFRRSFAEVFRSRSFLFLGSSVERYLLDLFSEIIELYGPSPYPHFAVFADENNAKDHLREELVRTHGINALMLDGFAELPGFLDRLRAAIYPGHKKGRVSIPYKASSVWRTELNSPRLEVSLSRLLNGAGEWNVFSIGGYSENPEISEKGMDTLSWKTNRVKAHEWKKYEATGFNSKITLWSDRKEPPQNIGVYARMAPNDPSASKLRPTNPTSNNGLPPYARDLRLISHATIAVMSEAARRGIKEVHAELIAGGRWRPYPAAYAFMQMIRGWTSWRQQFVPDDRLSPPCLTIHLVPAEDGDRDVIRALDSGRLVLESLLDPQQLMFWADVPGLAMDRMRTPVVYSPDDAILSVIEKLFPLQRDKDLAWLLRLEPAPCLNWGPWSVDDVHTWQRLQDGKDMSLRTFGVMPYSVLSISPPAEPQ